MKVFYIFLSLCFFTVSIASADNYQIVATKTAKKDINLLGEDHLSDRFQTLLNLIKQDPGCREESFEVLKGNLKGYVSRRLNDKHRLVYTVNKAAKVVIIYSARGHYDD